MKMINTQTINRTRLRRTPRGAGALVELACGMFFILAFIGICLDLSILIYGADLNDRACRDAARSAGEGRNIQQATQLALATLNAHSTAMHGVVGSPVLQLPIVYQNYGGSPPPRTSPYVQLTTITEVKVPFAVRFFGGPAFEPKGTVNFTQQYTFPIIRPQ